MSVDTDGYSTSHNVAGSNTLQRGLLFLIIIAFLITSMLYSFAIPVYESQDEKAHFEFIRFVALEMRLPDFRNREDLQAAGVQSIQTPLYYAFQGALLRASGKAGIGFRFDKNPLCSKARPAIYFHNKKSEKFPYRGKFRVFHLLRLTNIVAGILILLLIYKSVSLIAPTETLLPIMATGFVVFIPQFTYICGTLSNDAFSVLFASLSLYLMLRLMCGASVSTRLVALMSVSVALAILSKQMTLWLIPVCGTALLIRGGSRETFREKAKNILVMACILLALLGWYYARNQVLFDDVFNLRTQMETFSPLLVEKKTLPQFFSYFRTTFLPGFIKSFWGSFGYTTVWLSWNTYLFYNVLAGVGLLSCAVGALDPNFRKRFSREQKTTMALLGLATALLLAEVLSFNLSLSQRQGRYGFSCLCCLAIFWAVGMDRFVLGKRAHRNLFFLLLTLLFVVMNLCILGGVVRKAFPPPPSRFDVIQDKGKSSLLTLDKDNVVGQTFHCNIDGLDQVAVKLRTRGTYRNCFVIFQLRDLSDPQTTLVRIRLPGYTISTGEAYHVFKFPPIEDSSGRDYVFLIRAVEARGYSAIRLVHTTDDVYEKGTAFLNGRPLPEDLAFITGKS